MRRCKHHWQEVNRTFTPPIDRLKSVQGLGQDEFMLILYGLTTVELHCTECGDIKFETTLGRA